MKSDVKNRKLHLIGNAHLDPVWLWQWQEGYAEIKATFRSALDRLREFPEFIFTCSAAAYYVWVDENAPEILNSTFLNAAGSTNWQQSLPPVTAPPPPKGSTVASFPTQTKPR